MGNQIKQALKDENDLAGYIQRLNDYQETKKKYESIAKYTDKTKGLLVLDGLIEKGIYRYNSLQELVETRVNLDKEQIALKTKLDKLQKEFTKLMPNTCPLCGRGE